ncbi:hypothetical protein GDO86_016014 [Hymenochirus boettgeri]|uniref:Uncharacterized protein n=1 Tax=Hymenochirus boettgeri TaxID=247094 RepID=A0A8T2K3P0_9PIPI|nr:hypothetical protein GDO86_016014 [Hymenochirus boettgeri]
MITHLYVNSSPAISRRAETARPPLNQCILFTVAANFAVTVSCENIPFSGTNVKPGNYISFLDLFPDTAALHELGLVRENTKLLLLQSREMGMSQILPGNPVRLSVSP